MPSLIKSQNTIKMQRGPVSEFIQHHYRHFNAAALMDAAKGYETHLAEGGKMMVTLAGAMSTAELGLRAISSLQKKVHKLYGCQSGRRYHESCGPFSL